MSSSTIRKTLALATLGLAGLAATGAAHAGVSWHIGINLPGPAVVYDAPPVVYSPPPPVVYQPPPVVYAPPPPVVYRPAPIVYQPAPVYYGAPRGDWHGGRWQEHRHHHHRGDRWRDNDDRRAWRHNDRNGDGIPDRYRY